MVKAAFTNIENVNGWFMSQKLPYFTLYRGDKVSPSNTVLRNVDISDLDDAWNFLEVHLSNLSMNGGTYLLFITDKPKHNIGLSTLIELTPVYQQQPVGIAGIPGIPPYVGGSQNLDTYIQGQISVAVEKAVLQRKVEDLEAALEEKESGGFIGRIIENVTGSEQLAPLLDLLITRFMGNGAAPVMAGIQGFNTTKTQAPNTDPEQAELNQDLADEEQRVFVCIDKLAIYFDNPVDALEKITQFVEKNPTMAKHLLSRI